MLTAQFIRENRDRVARDMTNRGADVDLDRVIALDEQRPAAIQEVEALRADRNAASKLIGQTRDPDERNRRIESQREVNTLLETSEASLKETESALHELLLTIPNVLDPAVPVGKDESENVVVETVGEPRSFGFSPLPHWELGELLGGIDFERGVKMSGSRFFVLRGGVARLHRALIQWMLNSHVAEGFEEAYVPYMLNEESLIASGQLPKFRDNLYHDDEEDYFFIPTAEVALVNLYRDEIIEPGMLPMRLTAHTPCFRREKMSAGRDVRGIKRVHQFEKVEMFVYCDPGESEAELDRLVKQARSLPEALEIPYRVLALCSADVGFNATRTFDIEMHAPGADEWLEVSSASNCLDFQARRANIRYRSEAGGPTRFPHMLNASGLGLVRTLVAVMENYQQEDGSIEVPAVLRPYAGTARIEPANA